MPRMSYLLLVLTSCMVQAMSLHRFPVSPSPCSRACMLRKNRNPGELGHL